MKLQFFKIYSAKIQIFQSSSGASFFLARISKLGYCVTYQLWTPNFAKNLYFLRFLAQKFKYFSFKLFYFLWFLSQKSSFWISCMTRISHFLTIFKSLNFLHFSTTLSWHICQVVLTPVGMSVVYLPSNALALPTMTWFGRWLNGPCAWLRVHLEKSASVTTWTLQSEHVTHVTPLWYCDFSLIR